MYQVVIRKLKGWGLFRRFAYFSTIYCREAVELDELIDHYLRTREYSLEIRYVGLRRGGWFESCSSNGGEKHGT